LVAKVRRIAVHQLRKARIAEVGMELLVVIGEHFREPGDISMTVDVEQNLPLFLGAVLNLHLRQNRIVAVRSQIWSSMRKGWPPSTISFSEMISNQSMAGTA
jgi:hypothetical protein